MKTYIQPKTQTHRLLVTKNLLAGSNNTVNNFKGTKEAVTLGGDADASREVESPSVWE
ncbi:MAG: hypothetical protein IJS97_03020 [Prevotella sp.]|nr:hypothetical protein [Prevotella sp.]